MELGIEIAALGPTGYLVHVGLSLSYPRWMGRAEGTYPTTRAYKRNALSMLERFRHSYTNFTY